MAGFLSKIFGGKKKATGGGIEDVVCETLDGLIERGGFELTYDCKIETEASGESHLQIDITGADEDLMKEREGQLIDAFQLFLQRAIQHRFAEDKTKISIDCGGYREESNQALIELADKLKGQALEKGKSVYFRALPPKDRKVIHQYLAGDDRVKSRSIGEGLYKKIKIYPSKGGQQADAADDSAQHSD